MPHPIETAAAHDALPGIPSPAATTRLIGHAAAERSLRDAFESGRMHHAWLLQGPPGIGKATLAFSVARHFLSEGGEDRQGDTALQIAAGSHPGLIHLVRPANDRGGFRTQVTVDEIRRLQHFFQMTAAGRGWRIALIDPVDDLNRSAANALLKYLEEPPSRSLFLLVNHRPGRLLPTIRSRCRTLRCEALTPENVGAVLAAFDLDASSDAVSAAIAMAEGSVREAIARLLGGGLAVENGIDAILAAREPDWQAIFAFADGLTQRGREANFDLAVSSLLKRLAQEGLTALAANDDLGADARARLWSAEETRIRDGLLFNLDRKQLLITHFRRRFAVRGSGSTTA